MEKDKLDKWYFTNLNSRRDKADAHELTSAIQQFPPGILERFPAAVETKNMPETVREMCELIQADGFHQWSYDKIRQDPFLNESPERSAINWTRLKLIRHIIEKDYHAVMITDNNYPMFSFDHILKTINSAPVDMSILYLNFQGEPHNPTFNEQCYNALAQLEPTGVNGILKNFAGISAQIYFTPSGAADVLDRWLENPFDFQCLQMAIGGMKGCYVCDPSLVLAVGDMRVMYPSLISKDNRFLIKDRGVYIQGTIIQDRYYEVGVVQLKRRIKGMFPHLDSETALRLAVVANSMDTGSCEGLIDDLQRMYLCH